MFCASMKLNYARHFMMLVMGLHLVECHTIPRKDIDSIRMLFDGFLRRFPELYTPRHNTQSVHSLNHVADTIKDFGCLGNYSTFNFESVLGIFISKIFIIKSFSI